MNNDIKRNIKKIKKYIIILCVFSKNKCLNKWDSNPRPRRKSYVKTMVYKPLSYLAGTLYIYQTHKINLMWMVTWKYKNYKPDDVIDGHDERDLWHEADDYFHVQRLFLHLSYLFIRFAGECCLHPEFTKHNFGIEDHTKNLGRSHTNNRSPHHACCISDDVTLK